MKYHPQVWALRRGYVIMDPDGWRVDDKSFDEPVTEEEFNQRVGVSTIGSAEPWAIVLVAHAIHDAHKRKLEHGDD